jgi:hypothetical protein
MAGPLPMVKKMTTANTSDNPTDGQHDQDHGAERGPGPEWNGHGRSFVDWSAGSAPVALTSPGCRLFDCRSTADAGEEADCRLPIVGKVAG